MRNKKIFKNLHAMDWHKIEEHGKDQSAMEIVWMKSWLNDEHNNGSKKDNMDKNGALGGSYPSSSM